AFAVDSILAAVALAVSLPATGLFSVGSLDGAQFIVIFAGGMISVVIIRFAANFIVKILEKRPGLEVAAFVFICWVGIKLVLLVVGHTKVLLLRDGVVHSTAGKSVFYICRVIIALTGWFLFNKGDNTGGSEDFTVLEK